MEIENPGFGDGKIDFVEWLTIDGRQVKLTICDCEPGEEAKAITLATSVREWLVFGLIEAKHFATDELLNLKNNAWLDVNELPVTKQFFFDRMKLKSVLVYAEGNVELYFDDGSLFGEHDIIVCVNEYREFTEASITG